MTTVELLNVPFESNYKDTVWFPRTNEGKLEQENYFSDPDIFVRRFNEFSYQRKDNIIRVPAHIDTLYNCNYVRYKNANISNKWFYAFIIDMKYVNDERTDITIQTDVMQTWWFDYKVKTSFVEREHVDDDTIGLHTVPEQLETGEYVVDNKIDKTSLRSYGIILGLTVDPLGISTEDLLNGDIKDVPNVAGEVYGDIYSGVLYVYCGTPEQANNIIKGLTDKGKADAIITVFIAPREMFNTTNQRKGIAVVNTKDGLYVEPGDRKRVAWNSVAADVLPKMPTSLNGYNEVRNNKLFTFPYCYLLASNNSGGANIYHYELFSQYQPTFYIIGSVTPGMSIRLIPGNYAGVMDNNNEGLNLGKFPICAWNTDVYTNWLTQNAVNVGVDIASAGVQIVGGVASVATGVGAGFGVASIASGVMGVANTIGQVYQHSLIPPAVSGNLNSGDVTFADGKLTFTLYQMSIKKEYAQIIDDYFDMFGYKVNRVKLPNENHRYSYWYTKTIDVNIDGAIPNKDLEQIKQNYNNGITFWRGAVIMGDYGQFNDVYEV